VFKELSDNEIRTETLSLRKGEQLFNLLKPAGYFTYLQV